MIEAEGFLVDLHLSFVRKTERSICAVGIETERRDGVEDSRVGEAVLRETMIPRFTALESLVAFQRRLLLSLTMAFVCHCICMSGSRS